jgi:DNA adenine methylase
MKTETQTKRKLLGSPLRYPGGKTRVLNTLYAALPEDMKEFREPMCGGAGLTLRVRQERPDVACWLNDAYVDCVVFWRALRSSNTPQFAEFFPLVEVMRLCDGRALHKWLRSQNVPDSPDRIAARFFVLNRISFSGATEAGGYSASAGLERFTASSVSRLRAVVPLLRHLHVTTGDYREVLDEEGDDVCVYLDPPYITARKLYGKNGQHHAFDYERLRDALNETKHRFMLTIDDCEKARELYGHFNVKPLRVQYGMANSKGSCAAGSELLITNY